MDQPISFKISSATFAMIFCIGRIVTPKPQKMTVLIIVSSYLRFAKHECIFFCMLSRRNVLQ